MCKRSGQTILEFTLIVVIILGVMITMKDYIKRGVQGRWKSATDEFGEQYDPQSVNSNINYATQINSDSVIQVDNGTYTGPGSVTETGQWTTRNDTSNSVETTNGSTQIGE